MHIISHLTADGSATPLRPLRCTIVLLASLLVMPFLINMPASLSPDALITLHITTVLTAAVTESALLAPVRLRTSRSGPAGTSPLARLS